MSPLAIFVGFLIWVALVVLVLVFLHGAALARDGLPPAPGRRPANRGGRRQGRNASEAKQMG